MPNYDFSISTDFPSGIATDTLTATIQASAIVTALDCINTSGDLCSIVFKAALSPSDETLLAGIVATHSGTPLAPNPTVMSLVGITPSQGRFPTTITRAAAPKLTFISPNWCDKTTWYPDSVEIENEIATDAGDHLTYTLSHTHLIDSYHGKISFEDNLTDEAGHSYRVVVKVNGNPRVEQDPEVGSGGDYTIDYASGNITFALALVPSDVVSVTYHYARNATFILEPEAGKRLIIGTVEIQFSEDVQMNDTFVFQAYGLVDVFAPQLIPGIPSGTKIPIGAPLVYKTFNDLLNDSNCAYPGYPAFGGNNWRALKKQAFIFVWDYSVGVTLLESKYGMEIHLDLKNNNPCGGAFGTATFYCTSEAE